jgi:hypothetical protein
MRLFKTCFYFTCQKKLCTNNNIFKEFFGRLKIDIDVFEKTFESGDPKEPHWITSELPPKKTFRLWI